jgi:hypothetical protein
MKRLTIGLIVLVGIAVVTPSADAGPFGWRRRRAQVYYAPAPTATVAQDQAGYRTYSYEPGMYQPMYQPAPSYRSSNRMPTAGFQDAGWKIRGQW